MKWTWTDEAAIVVMRIAQLALLFFMLQSVQLANTTAITPPSVQPATISRPSQWIADRPRFFVGCV